MSEQRTPEQRRRCPDGGVCHHACEVGCFRVRSCEPLSGVYDGNEWPASVRDLATIERLREALSKLEPMLDTMVERQTLTGSSSARNIVRAALNPEQDAREVHRTEQNDV